MIDEKDKMIHILQNIIKNVIDSHFNEQETLLIFHNLKLPINIFSFEDILSLFELISNCPIISMFCKLLRDNITLPEVDYKYKYEILNNEIRAFYDIFHPISNFPMYFEKDIFKACSQNKLTIIRYLIEKAEISVGIKGDNGQTLLHVAADNGYFAIVQYLILNHANIEERDSFGRTPLHYASMNGHFEIVKYLISHGADIEKQDNDGRASLLYASMNVHYEIVDYLISHGANIEAYDKDQKKSTSLFKYKWSF